ncbi:acetohydroxy acid synthase large subunit, putative [Roseobacter sp. AzwK-3b]|uniref:5-guanidino-2-oxopentanoate decarboxylase n=1 Tax=Roseobacter sp. AzwK-3b TaxID=351016 RepID=UPI0001569ACF|nr:5-guanidino-2-oxopentanoate decarboxylase [Roseobacter sp. AzwK-3b]EDM71776.1 acetohydroxy acid synthase large subunit, putative [Roseobacter sp. AzwK-3b]
MTTRPLGAQISHMLKSRGVETIFGIPGVHNQEMYRGIEEAGITHILARHEQGAGFIADGYARASGKPCIAYVITGPGLCNIMTPIGQAYSDSVPMLVISSCLDETAARRGQLHQMKDQEGAARAVADWSETALTAQAAYDLIDRAMTEFALGRARPKHLSVPIRLLQGMAEAAPSAPTRPSARPGTAPDVAAAVEVLRAARRPLIVAGGGATKAAAALNRLREVTGAATFTTYAGRGIFTPGTPLHYGNFLARPGSADEIAKADVVLAIGTELSQVDLWRDHLGHMGKMIRVDIDAEVLSDLSRADITLAGDAAAVAEALCAALGKPFQSLWTQAEIDAARDRWRREVDGQLPGIGAICDALRACLPKDTMIFSDMTQFAYNANEIWELEAPGLWHHPSGFGTLGYALPAAIGGAVARPGLPTMCVAGDYGFQYTLPELGVAVELGLPLPILLWDNGKLKEIEDSMVRSQIAPNAVVARNPDFCALARAYGAGAEEPQSLGALTKAVNAAFAASGPTLIRVTPDLLGG